MFLNEYRMEIFRPDCNPNFQSLHCIAHLDRDIAGVLPCLNASLGGSTYTKDPPSVTFQAHGKLITVHADRIAVNALKDEGEAEKILQWLKGEINEAWEKRGRIRPRYEGLPRPKILEILKMLPRTNCRRCGQPTCVVFAVLAAEGAKGPEDCPGLGESNKEMLRNYLGKVFGPESP